MSIAWNSQEVSASYRQLPLLLTVIGCHIHVAVCAPKCSKEEYELPNLSLQKIIRHKTVNGLKIAYSGVSWMLQG